MIPDKKALMVLVDANGGCDNIGEYGENTLTALFDLVDAGQKPGVYLEQEESDLIKPGIFGAKGSERRTSYSNLFRSTWKTWTHQTYEQECNKLLHRLPVSRLNKQRRISITPTNVTNTYIGGNHNSQITGGHQSLGSGTIGGQIISELKGGHQLFGDGQQSNTNTHIQGNQTTVHGGEYNHRPNHAATQPVTTPEDFVQNPDDFDQIVEMVKRQSLGEPRIGNDGDGFHQPPSLHGPRAGHELHDITAPPLVTEAEQRSLHEQQEHTQAGSMGVPVQEPRQQDQLDSKPAALAQPTRHEPAHSVALPPSLEQPAVLQPAVNSHHLSADLPPTIEQEVRIIENEHARAQVKRLEDGTVVSELSLKGERTTVVTPEMAQSILTIWTSHVQENESLPIVLKLFGPRFVDRGVVPMGEFLQGIAPKIVELDISKFNCGLQKTDGCTGEALMKALNDALGSHLPSLKILITKNATFDSSYGVAQLQWMLGSPCLLEADLSDNGLNANLLYPIAFNLVVGSLLLKKLDLSSNQNLGQDGGGLLLGQLLSELRGIETVRLSNCGLCEHEILPVLCALVGRSSLAELDIDCATLVLDGNMRNLIKLVEVVDGTDCLHTLSVRSCGVETPHQWEILLGALRRKSKLQVARISSNEWAPGCEGLLSQLVSLPELVAGELMIEEDVTIRGFGNAISNMSGLENLDLDAFVGGGFDTEAISGPDGDNNENGSMGTGSDNSASFMQTLANNIPPTVANLRLSNNFIGDQSSDDMGRCVERLKSIRVLDLSCNDLGGASVDRLVALPSQQKELMDLNVQDNPLGGIEGAKTLKRHFPTVSTDYDSQLEGKVKLTMKPVDAVQVEFEPVAAYEVQVLDGAGNATKIVAPNRGKTIEIILEEGTEQGELQLSENRRQGVRFGSFTLQSLRGTLWTIKGREKACQALWKSVREALERRPLDDDGTASSDGSMSDGQEGTENPDPKVLMDEGSRKIELVAGHALRLTGYQDEPFTVLVGAKYDVEGVTVTLQEEGLVEYAYANGKTEMAKIPKSADDLKVWCMNCINRGSVCSIHKVGNY